MTDVKSLNPQLNDFFSRQLRKGERILWSGQPDLSIVFSKADIVLVPASALWAGMAIFFSSELVSAARANSSYVPLVIFFAVPFTLMAFHATLGRFVLRRCVKSRTYYLLTDQRVLALGRMFGDSAHETFLDDIDQVTTVRTWRGAGSLWFGKAPGWLLFLGTSVFDFPNSLAEGIGPVAFYDLRDADQVYSLVAELKSK